MFDAGTRYQEGDKVKKYVTEGTAVIGFCLAIIGLIHQQIVSNDVWFHFRQMRNHETIVACCIIGALALLAGKYLGKYGF